jgi:hypothetical protein
VHGPIGHFFYGALDEKFPKKDAQTVAIKVLIDQVRACLRALVDGLVDELIDWLAG